MKLRSVGAFALVVSLGACVSGPEHRVPPLQASKVPDRYVGAEPQAGADDADIAVWWQSYGDVVLDTLIERGLAANLDIEISGARLRQARTLLRVEQARQLPSLETSQSVSKSQDTSSGNSNASMFQAGLDAAYELDLFGGARRSIEAAAAEAGKAQASLHAMQLTVAAEIALYYIDARLAQARLRITLDTLQAQDETLQIARWREQAGLVSTLDIEQARQQQAQTQASIPAIESSYRTALNRLAVLLGDAPGSVNSMIDPVLPIPMLTRAIPVGIPAQLLLRRPDIATAERTLAAETARIGVRLAELRPSFRLSGSLTKVGEDAASIFDPSLATLAAKLASPLFQGGKLRANVNAQRAAADVALASYRQTVLLALEETENALAIVASTEQRQASLQIAVEAARNAAMLARAQYRAGLIDFQRLLDTQRSQLSSEESLVSVHAEQARAATRLYKALGGGWQAAPEPRSTTIESAHFSTNDETP